MQTAQFGLVWDQTVLRLVWSSQDGDFYTLMLVGGGEDGVGKVGRSDQALSRIEDAATAVAVR
jgi:hypothetical protein